MKKKMMMLALLVTILSGCTTPSKVDDDGQLVGELVWPKVSEEVVLDNDRGVYVPLEQIALVREGATRDQIYQLIGRPAFLAGFHVREWDYLFNFPQDNGIELTCQFKILFDYDYVARNIFWHNVSDKGTCPPQ